MNGKDAIERAVQDVTQRAPRPIHGEIIRKEWPADGIVYVRLYTDGGRAEWALLETGSSYDKAYAMLLEPARRILGGGNCGV